MSIPPVMFGEARMVVRDAHGSDELITFTEHPEYGVDFRRMTAHADCDLLIFPKWSNGREFLLSARRSESIRFTEREDDEPGLQVVRSLSNGGSEEFTIDGYARVMRLD